MTILRLLTRLRAARTVHSALETGGLAAVTTALAAAWIGLALPDGPLLGLGPREGDSSVSISLQSTLLGIADRRATGGPTLHGATASGVLARLSAPRTRGTPQGRLVVPLSERASAHPTASPTKPARPRPRPPGERAPPPAAPEPDPAGDGGVPDPPRQTPPRPAEDGPAPGPRGTAKGDAAPPASTGGTASPPATSPGGGTVPDGGGDWADPGPSTDPDAQPDGEASEGDSSGGGSSEGGAGEGQDNGNGQGQGQGQGQGKGQGQDNGRGHRGDRAAPPHGRFGEGE